MFLYTIDRLFIIYSKNLCEPYLIETFRPIIKIILQIFIESHITLTHRFPWFFALVIPEPLLLLHFIGNLLLRITISIKIIVHLQPLLHLDIFANLYQYFFL